MAKPKIVVAVRVVGIEFCRLLKTCLCLRDSVPSEVGNPEVIPRDGAVGGGLCGVLKTVVCPIGAIVLNPRGAELFPSVSGIIGVFQDGVGSL